MISAAAGLSGAAAACGADGFWLRGVQQPEPNPKTTPAKAIESGDRKAMYYERIEVLHDYGCRIRHRDQGVNLTTNAA